MSEEERIKEYEKKINAMWSSYCVSKLTPYFDWHAFLSKDEYTIEELNQARDMSVNWITCACGAQCSVIPRNDIGAPMDDLLRSLGNHFHESISGMRWSYRNNFYFFNAKMNAISYLHSIEKRAAELIQEEEKKKEIEFHILVYGNQ